MDFATIKVNCNPELIDLLIAELFELGFDSFQEFENSFEGSCDQSVYDEEAVRQILVNYPDTTFELKETEKVNWNEEWEKNYDPIIVDNKCMVRATFHDPDPSYEYEILVNPKMSFGTGHHATTYLMLSHQMKLDHTDKKVLDVGSGTGILAIMAAKRGAKEIVATDIDDWCIENSTENFKLNQVESIQVLKGEINMVDQTDFDIIIANINKNVLLTQLGAYSERLKAGGQLLLSGFYTEDNQDLIIEAQEHGLTLSGSADKENWSMLVLFKQFV